MRTSMDGLPCATGEEETQRQAPCQSRGVLHELDWQGRQACWHRPESGMTSSHSPAEALGSASCSGRKRLRDNGVESLRLVAGGNEHRVGSGMLHHCRHAIAALSPTAAAR